LFVAVEMGPLISFVLVSAFAGSIRAYPVLHYVPYDQVGNGIEFQEPVVPWFGRTLIQPEGNVSPYDDDAVAPTEDETISYMPIKRAKKPQQLQTGYFDYDLSKVNLNIDTGIGYLRDDVDDDGEVSVEDVDVNVYADDNDSEVDWDQQLHFVNEDNSRSLVPVFARYEVLDDDEDYDYEGYGVTEYDDDDDEYYDDDAEYYDDDDDQDDYHHNKYQHQHHDLWSHKSKVGSHLHGTWGYDTYKYPLDIFHQGQHGYTHPLDKYREKDDKYSLGMKTLYQTLKKNYNNKYISHPSGHGHHGGYHWKHIQL